MPEEPAVARRSKGSANDDARTPIRMLTQCPECRTAFRVLPEVLTRAYGLARCGCCGAIFSAVERLAAEPRSADPGEHLPERRLSDEDHAILFTEPGTGGEFDGPGLSIEDIAVDDELDDAPPALRHELRALAGQGSAVPARTAWMVGAFVLSTVLALQLAWWFRDPLLAWQPGLVPLAGQVCAIVGCPDEPPKEVGSIELLARDVREHPQYVDSVLVNATLVNKAPRPQPFPTVELSLFDRSGDPIGVRRFAPPEYLDASIDSESGMQPEQPVFIVLELYTPGVEAVSFEFGFL